MVGRDIGTVVMPDAAVKVYMDASADERAGAGTIRTACAWQVRGVRPGAGAISSGGTKSTASVPLRRCARRPTRC